MCQTETRNEFDPYVGALALERLAESLLSHRSPDDAMMTGDAPALLASAHLLEQARSWLRANASPFGDSPELLADDRPNQYPIDPARVAAALQNMAIVLFQVMKYRELRAGAAVVPHDRVGTNADHGPKRRTDEGDW